MITTNFLCMIRELLPPMSKTDLGTRVDLLMMRTQRQITSITQSLEASKALVMWSMGHALHTE